MTVSIYDIISAIPVFTKILQYEFTAKQSFMIGRALRTLNTETESFNKTREEVLRKYAECDTTGEMIVENGNAKIREGEMANFQNEINDLLYTDLEVDIKPIPVDWLDDVKLTPQETLILEPFIQFEE